MDEESTGGLELRQDHQLMGADSGRQDQNARKIYRNVKILGQ
jgi:hypothetical protein